MAVSSNVVGNSNDVNSFLDKLSLTNRQALRLHKTFANNSSANKKLLKIQLKLSKTQLYKIKQSGRFLSRLLWPLLKTGLLLIGNVLKPLAESVLIPLRLTAAASSTGAAIHKKMFGSGNTTLIISNEEMNDIIKIIKSLEESGLLIKGVSETVKNEAKEEKGGFVSMLLGALSASLLGNLLSGKGTIRAGEGLIKAGQDF